MVGWALVVGLVVVQAWALYVAGGAAEPLVPGQDKAGHGLLFGLPAALSWALQGRWAVGALVVHALVSEPAQALLTSTRTADVWDLVANLVGIGFGVWLAARWRGTRGKATGRERSE